MVRTAGPETRTKEGDEVGGKNRPVFLLFSSRWNAVATSGLGRAINHDSLRSLFRCNYSEARRF
jgi:hypothetical protein